MYLDDSFVYLDLQTFRPKKSMSVTSLLSIKKFYICQCCFIHFRPCLSFESRIYCFLELFKCLHHLILNFSYVFCYWEQFEVCSTEVLCLLFEVLRKKLHPSTPNQTYTGKVHMISSIHFHLKILLLPFSKAAYFFSMCDLILEPVLVCCKFLSDNHTNNEQYQ